MSTMQSPGSALSAAALGSWRQNLAALLDAHEHAGGSLFGAPGAPPLLLPPPQQPVLSLQESASLSLPAACRYDSVSQPWTLSVDGAPCLLDHLVDGRPVLPMALALETMAQFAAQQAPQWVVVEVRELAVLSGIALDARHRPRPLLLRGRPVPTAEGTLCWAVEIADARRGNTCYRAQVLLQAQLPSPPAAMDWAASRGEALTAQHIYGEILFHGPWFQRITRIDALDARGADAQLHAAVASALFDPGLLDLPPQLAFIWARLRQGMGALPSRLGRVQRYASVAGDAPLQLRWRLKPSPHAAALRYDAEMIDATGQLCLRIIDGESTMSTALSRLSPGLRDRKD